MQVSLEAMNPAVPGDAESSSIPIALFRFTVQNGGDKPVEVSLMEAQQNFSKMVMLSRSVVLPSCSPGRHHYFSRLGRRRVLHLRQDRAVGWQRQHAVRGHDERRGWAGYVVRDAACNNRG